MNLKFLYLMAPILLSGCIGAWISGNTGYLSEEYPDIRTVPQQPEASKPRGMHRGNEQIARETDFEKLEQDREKISKRGPSIKSKFRGMG